MEAQKIGRIIAELRKKNGLTQMQLADKLCISNKTVSRWESGLGYPEITQLPTLAAVLGITVDYLLTGERKGITVAGNMLTDIVKRLDCYPACGMLANVLDIQQAVGGCAPNTAIDLAVIDRNLPISVCGKIGDDEYGRYILSRLGRNHVDCSRVSISTDKPTSFSDVMSVPSGERTFFHARGANVTFGPEDVDIAGLNCVIFHIGYILLLDRFDEEDAEYGTVMARFLHDVQAHGIKTSIDVVSDSTDRYKQKVLPALRYCNYAILNEVESGMLTDLPPYDKNGKLLVENIEKTMRYMAAQGVKDKVIVHCKRAGFCYDVPTDTFTMIPSLCIPKEAIKGSVGAGDVFCAGCLYGIYNGYTDKQILEFAASSAACSLFAENSVDGMRDKEEIEKMAEKYGWGVL